MWVEAWPGRTILQAGSQWAEALHTHPLPHTSRPVPPPAPLLVSLQLLPGLPHTRLLLLRPCRDLAGACLARHDQGFHLGLGALGLDLRRE